MAAIDRAAFLLRCLHNEWNPARRLHLQYRRLARHNSARDYPPLADVHKVGSPCDLARLAFLSNPFLAQGRLPDLWMFAFWTLDVASRRCVLLPWTHVDVQLPSNLWRFSHGLPSHRPACAPGGPNPGILRGQCAHICSPTENIEPSRTHGVAAPQLPVMRCPTLYICGIRPLPAPRLPVPRCRDRNTDMRTPHS